MYDSLTALYPKDRQMLWERLEFENWPVSLYRRLISFASV